MKPGERKLLWEDGAQTVKETAVKLGRLVYKSLGQLACIFYIELGSLSHLWNPSSCTVYFKTFVGQKINLCFK